MNDHSAPTSAHYNEAYVEPVNGVPLKRISWSAIFAGVIISIVVYLLLSILGTAVGASTIDPLKEQNPLDHIGTGALIWTGVSMLISIPQAHSAATAGPADAKEPRLASAKFDHSPARQGCHPIADRRRPAPAAFPAHASKPAIAPPRQDGAGDSATPCCPPADRLGEPQTTDPVMPSAGTAPVQTVEKLAEYPRGIPSSAGCTDRARIARRVAFR